jgi:transposase
MICAAVERCAGIDVAKGLLGGLRDDRTTGWRSTGQRRRFGMTVAELEALRDWLSQERVTHVVIELIGSYWKPVVNVLQTNIQIYVADSEEVKKRKGHQTDDKDGWWLAHLLRHALIHPSFVPPLPIRELRDLTRRPATAERNDRGKEWHPGRTGRCQRATGQRVVRSIRCQRATHAGGITGR